MTQRDDLSKSYFTKTNWNIIIFNEMFLKVMGSIVDCNWNGWLQICMHRAIHIFIIAFTLLNSFFTTNTSAATTEYDKRKVMVSNRHFVIMFTIKTWESTVLHFMLPLLLPQYFTPIVDFYFCYTKQEKSGKDYFCVVYTFVLNETQLVF